MFEDGRCEKLKWHDWKVTAQRDEYQIERCWACGTRMAHKLDPDGRPVYGRRYYEAHIRDFCHPRDVYSHRIFFELYGHKKLEQDRKFMEKQQAREGTMEDLTREFRKYTSNERIYTDFGSR